MTDFQYEGHEGKIAMKDMSNSVATAVSIKNAVKTSAENGTGVDLQAHWIAWPTRC